MSETPRRRGRGIDQIDKRLIALLQDDGRAGYAEMGRRVGISAALARMRVHRLRRDGVIQIVAVTDPLKLGFSHESLVAIEARSNVSELADELAQIDEVDFVVLVAGAFDILLEIVAGTDEELLALIQRIRALAEPGTVRVLPYLKTWTQTYAWGAR